MTTERAGRSRRQVLAGLATAVAVSGCGRRVVRDSENAVDIVIHGGALFNIGVTPDLRRVALTNWGNDFSAIGVCNLQAGSVEVLRAGKEARLRMPALSPDGETIAFIAHSGDQGLQGLSSLYLVSARGGEVSRIGGRASYSAPIFSPDGGRLLALAGEGDLGPDQLVEIDTASGVERVVWSGAFEGASSVAYDPMGAGFWVDGYGPAASLEEATNRRTLDHNTVIEIGPSRIFRITGEDEEARPFSVNLDGYWRLAGVAKDEVVFSTGNRETGDRVGLVNRKGEVSRLWRSASGDDFPDGWGVSADAKQVLAVRMQRDDADRPLGKYELTVFETGPDENGRVLSRVLSSDLRATFHDLNLP